MEKLIIIYDPNEGHVVSDNELMLFANEYYKTFKASQLLNNEITVGSEMIILAFRVLVKQGIIDKNDIYFKYTNSKGKVFKIECNGNGEISEYPKGFGDVFSNFMLELV